jgi:phage terminase small subunit
MADKLTDKQRLFVSEYLKDFNATRAAKAAGYSDKTAGSIGAENLTKPEIKEYIKKYIDDTLDTDRMTLQREIIDQLRVIAFDDNEVDINRTDDGEILSVSRRDKLRALEMLGKYMSMFTDRREVEHSTLDENGKKKGLEIIVKCADD